MKKLNYAKLQNLEGGDVIEGICVGLGLSGSIWSIAANSIKRVVLPGPIGTAFLVAGVGCAIYAGVKHEL